jgi:hypothetical protein
MKETKIYQLTKAGAVGTYYGEFIVKELGITVFTPVLHIEKPLILMSECEGPTMVVNNDQRWSVRHFGVAYRLERIRNLDRYTENPAAVHLYPFERVIMDGGGWKCSSGNESTIQNLKLARPKLMSVKEYRQLVETAVVFTTDFPKEVRFNRPV